MATKLVATQHYSAAPDQVYALYSDRGFVEARLEANGGLNPEVVSLDVSDGGVDIVVVNRDQAPFVVRDVAPARGHWVTLRVIEPNGRDSLGAEVTATVGARRITRVVRAAYSYLASNDPRVHLGLGAATTITNVTVRWPNGTTESFGDQQADRSVTLQRGKGRPAK